jgi:hypothetical protein
MPKIVAKPVEYDSLEWDDLYIYQGRLYIRGGGGELEKIKGRVYGEMVNILVTEEEGENQ